MGWAVVERYRMDENGKKIDADDLDWLFTSGVLLLVVDDRYASDEAIPVDQIYENDITVVLPGETYTDQRRAYIEEQVRKGSNRFVDESAATEVLR